MKKLTISATSALLLASNVFAVETKIDNVKIEGNAGVYYSTNNSGSTGTLFDQPSSIADAFASLKVTADLNKRVKGGLAATTVSTLGLENNLVSNTFTGSHPNTVDDFTVVSEAWITIDAGASTSATLGRQKLDTPLVFSETWNVLPNTYQAAVIANKSVKNLTLVGAYVGRGNGAMSNGPLNASANGYVVTTGGEYNTFGADSNTTSGNNGGAYALGAVYAMGDLTVQAWGYNVANVADASWVQVDQAPKTGLGFGLQYTTIGYKQTAHTALDSDAMAAKVSYAKKDTYNAYVAYSQTAKEGQAGFNVGGGKQSKLYTEAWWNRGYVTRADTSAITVNVEKSLNKTLDAALRVTSTSSDVANNEMTEATLTVKKDFDGLKATLAYIRTDANDQNKINSVATAFDTVQVYLDAAF